MPVTGLPAFTQTGQGGTIGHCRSGGDILIRTAFGRSITGRFRKMAGALLWLAITAAISACSASAGVNAGASERAARPSLTPRLIAVSVSDMDRSLAWYRDMLGFEIVETYDFEADGMRVGFASRGGFEIEIIEITGAPAFDAPEPGNPATRQGWVKFAFATDDIDALYARVTAAGAQIHSPLSDSRRTGGRFFILLDPDGNWVQVFSAP